MERKYLSLERPPSRLRYFRFERCENMSAKNAVHNSEKYFDELDSSPDMMDELSPLTPLCKVKLWKEECEMEVAPTAPVLEISESPLHDEVEDIPESMAEPDRSVAEPDRSVAEPDRSVAEPDRSVAEPDWSVAEPDRSVAQKTQSSMKAAVVPVASVYTYPPVKSPKNSNSSKIRKPPSAFLLKLMDAGQTKTTINSTMPKKTTKPSIVSAPFDPVEDFVIWDEEVPHRISIPKRTNNCRKKHNSGHQQSEAKNALACRQSSNPTSPKKPKPGLRQLGRDDCRNHNDSHSADLKKDKKGHLKAADDNTSPGPSALCIKDSLEESRRIRTHQDIQKVDVVDKRWNVLRNCVDDVNQATKIQRKTAKKPRSKGPMPSSKCLKQRKEDNIGYVVVNGVDINKRGKEKPRLCRLSSPNEYEGQTDIVNNAAFKKTKLKQIQQLPAPTMEDFADKGVHREEAQCVTSKQSEGENLVISSTSLKKFTVKGKEKSKHKSRRRTDHLKKLHSRPDELLDASSLPGVTDQMQDHANDFNEDYGLSRHCGTPRKAQHSGVSGEQEGEAQRDIPGSRKRRPPGNWWEVQHSAAPEDNDSDSLISSSQKALKKHWKKAHLEMRLNRNSAQGVWDSNENISSSGQQRQEFGVALSGSRGLHTQDLHLSQCRSRGNGDGHQDSDPKLQAHLSMLPGSCKSMTETVTASMRKGMASCQQDELSSQTDILRGFKSGPSSMIESHKDLSPQHDENIVDDLSEHHICTLPLIPVMLHEDDRMALLKWLTKLWCTPGGSPVFTPEHFKWYEYQGGVLGYAIDLECHTFSSGKILLGSYMKKPLQVDNSAVSVYSILTSTVQVTINRVKRHLYPGQTFMVPCGHAYAMYNLTAEPAVLFYHRMSPEMV